MLFPPGSPTKAILIVLLSELDMSTTFSEIVKSIENACNRQQVFAAMEKIQLHAGRGRITDEEECDVKDRLKAKVNELGLIK